MSKDFEKRILLLEDRENIRRLKYQYCELCDNNYNADALIELFTDDAIWDAGGDFGQFNGREEIHTFFSSMPSRVRFSVHTAINDIIDINGDEATGRWRANIPSSFITEAGDVPHWLFVEYDDAFRRVNGNWRFTRVRSIIHRSGPHQSGWE